MKDIQARESTRPGCRFLLKSPWGLFLLLLITSHCLLGVMVYRSHRIARRLEKLDKRLGAIHDERMRERLRQAALEAEDSCGALHARYRKELLEEVLAPIRGYTERFSVPEGKPVIIRFAGTLRHADLYIDRLRVRNALTSELVREVNGLSVPVPLTDIRFAQGRGAGFQGRASVPGAPLPYGTYVAHLIASNGEVSDEIYFNVHPLPGRDDRPRIAVLYSTITWYAYLPTGGGRLHSPGPQPRRASMLRPFWTPALPERPNGQWTSANNTPVASIVIPRFLTQQGYSLFCIDDRVLHANPEMLQGVELLILNVHPEYWTWEMRRNLEDYLERGGKLLVAAGNSMWWKVVLRGDEIVAYRVRGSDPRTDIREKTGRWDWPHIDDPAERTLGLSFRFGGRMVVESYPKLEDVPARFGMTPEEYANSTGVKILNAQHPMFAGTGLKTGGIWGTELPINWIEIDGAPLRADGTIQYDGDLPKGLAVSTSAKPRIPKTLTPLVSGCSLFWKNHLNRSVLMAEFLYRGRGRVLNLSTQGWYRAIALKNKPAEKILTNAVDYLLQAPVPVKADKPSGGQRERNRERRE